MYTIFIPGRMCIVSGWLTLFFLSRTCSTIGQRFFSNLSSHIVACHFLKIQFSPVYCVYTIRYKDRVQSLRKHPCVCIYCYFFYSVGLFFITGALIEKGPTDPYCVHDIENLFLLKGYKSKSWINVTGIHRSCQMVRRRLGLWIQ